MEVFFTVLIFFQLLLGVCMIVRSYKNERRKEINNNIPRNNKNNIYKVYYLDKNGNDKNEIVECNNKETAKQLIKQNNSENVVLFARRLNA